MHMGYKSSFIVSDKKCGLMLHSMQTVKSHRKLIIFTLSVSCMLS